MTVQQDGSIARSAVQAACVTLGLDPTNTLSVHIEGSWLTVRMMGERPLVRYRIEDNR